MTKGKVMLAMSGGVDSSVAVALLQKQGYEVEGITMVLGEPGVAEKARAAADTFGIRHRVADLTADFEQDVVHYFLQEYQQGRTPNPCVVCNQKVKLGKLFDYAKQFGFDYFATGHYAKIGQVNGRFAIQRAATLAKDQSYVLFMLGQEVLAKLLFPLGEYSKEQIRTMAREIGLASAEQKDSQDICFIPDGNYRKFLLEHGLTNCPGNFVDESGKIVGQHKGIANYTIGQRKGLGIALGHPVFVTAIRPQTNEVVLGLEQHLLAKTMLTTDNCFMLISELTEPLEVSVKVRYKSPAAAAVIRPLPGGLVETTFEQPEKAITPGQAAVFYQGDIVVGGGIIQSAALPAEE